MRKRITRWHSLSQVKKTTLYESEKRSIDLFEIGLFCIVQVNAIHASCASGKSQHLADLPAGVLPMISVFSAAHGINSYSGKPVPAYLSVGATGALTVANSESGASFDCTIGELVFIKKP